MVITERKNKVKPFFETELISKFIIGYSAIDLMGRIFEKSYFRYIIIHGF